MFINYGKIIKDAQGRLRAKLPEADFFISNEDELLQADLPADCALFRYCPEDQFAAFVPASVIRILMYSGTTS